MACYSFGIWYLCRLLPSCGNSMGLLWCLACGVWGWLISGLFGVIYGGLFTWLYGLGDFVVGSVWVGLLCWFAWWFGWY